MTVKVVSRIRVRGAMGGFVFHLRSRALHPHDNDGLREMLNWGSCYDYIRSKAVGGSHRLEADVGGTEARPGRQGESIATSSAADRGLFSYQHPLVCCGD